MNDMGISNEECKFVYENYLLGKKKYLEFCSWSKSINVNEVVINRAVIDVNRHYEEFCKMQGYEPVGLGMLSSLLKYQYNVGWGERRLGDRIIKVFEYIVPPAMRTEEAGY